MQARIAMYVQHSFATLLHPSPLQLWHSPAVSESSRDLLMSIEGDGTSEFPLIAPSNSTQAEPYAEYRRSIRRPTRHTWQNNIISGFTRFEFVARHDCLNLKFAKFISIINIFEPHWANKWIDCLLISETLLQDTTTGGFLINNWNNRNHKQPLLMVPFIGEVMESRWYALSEPSYICSRCGLVVKETPYIA